MFNAHNTKGRTRSRKLRESGHMLLAILLMMALMIIAATYEAPRIIQQMQRDREEEMIHRGTEYARGIKKFYKKFGRYPTSLEQLDDTNHIRFIRKHYKDPLTKDGKWTLLRYGDIATLLNAGAPGRSAASLASGAQGAAGAPAGQQGSSGFGSSGFGSASTTPSSSGGFGTSNFGSANANAQTVTGPQGGLFNQQSQSGVGQTGTSGSTFGASGQNASSGLGPSTAGAGSSFGNNQSSGFGSSSSPTGSNTGTGAGTSGFGSSSGNAQTFGGGAIVGVASVSKESTIRIYNKKKTYNEWQFIYNPMMDQQNVLLKGPYSPSTLMSNTNIGTPAGQQNQQQQSPFGQQNPGIGQQQPQQGGYNNQQPIAPGGQQFPPDQNH